MQSGPKYLHLGSEIIYDQKNGIVLKNQNAYVRDMIKQHGIVTSHNYPCRDDLGNDYKEDTTPLSKRQHAVYRSALQQAAYTDRPDIKYTVSILQRFASAPVMTDLHDLAHLFGYLNRHSER